MFGSGREGLPVVREWLEGPSGCPGDPLGCSGVVRRLTQMSESGQEVIPHFREWSVGPPGGQAVVGSSSRIREWSGDPHGCQAGLGRPSQMSGSCREALTDVKEWSGGPP